MNRRTNQVHFRSYCVWSHKKSSFEFFFVILFFLLACTNKEVMHMSDLASIDSNNCQSDCNSDYKTHTTIVYCVQMAKQFLFVQIGLLSNHAHNIIHEKVLVVVVEMVEKKTNKVIVVVIVIDSSSHECIGTMFQHLYSS